ncbi:MAG: hypothetical protein WBF93_19805 [Pirellulales bacterium]
MSLDRYSLCPGGTGKKIKFCCNELLGELQTLDKMLGGEQRQACLEHVDRTLKKCPDRPCLLAVKALLQSEMEQDDALIETLDRFEAAHPKNPIASCERAIFEASTKGGRAAVEPLQRALEAIEGDELPTRVYAAIGFVAECLLNEAEILAAHAHLNLQAGISGSKDSNVVSMIMSLVASPQLPLLLKQGFVLDTAPRKARWRRIFQEARKLAMQGHWRAAERKFVALLEKSDNAACVWRNLAILRSWLADTEPAIEAWKRFASLDGVAQDDAVEAAAISQLINTNQEWDQVDLVSVTYSLNDREVLVANLSSNKRVVNVPAGGIRPLEEGQPPPQAAFLILDRPMPSSGVGMTIDDAPVVLGQAYLFGRETDRAARVEYVVFQDQAYDKTSQALVELAGDSLAAAGEIKTLTQVTLLQHALSWNWRLPDDTPQQTRQQLVADQRRETLLKVWTALPNPELDGKTPGEAAANPALHTRVLASMLLLQADRDDQQSADDFGALRKSLGLPQVDPIDPAGVDVAKLPATRLERLKIDALTDEQLMIAYRRCVAFRADLAIRQFGLEIVQRDSFDEQENFSKAEVYGVLARLDPDSDRALEYLELARKKDAEAGRSPARWYAVELELRLARGEAAVFERLLSLLRTHHWHEPGIADAVRKLIERLQSAGGVPTDQPAAEPEPVDASPQEPASQIWTPDSAAGDPEKKTEIWTPDG